jgi:hypothetical protein
LGNSEEKGGCFFVSEVISKATKTMKPGEMDFERFRHFYPFEPKDERLTFVEFFEFEVGWASLLWILHADLEKLHRKAKRDSSYVGLQIIRVGRAKSGGLLFGEVGGSEEMKARIHKAEDDSLKICEVCGESGQSHRASGSVLGNVEPLFRVLCLQHAGKRGFEPILRSILPDPET